MRRPFQVSTPLPPTSYPFHTSPTMHLLLSLPFLYLPRPFPSCLFIMPIICASPSTLISLIRYGSRKCRLAITSQKPHRCPHRPRKTLSSAQKAAWKLEHASHHTTFNAALEDAFCVVIKEAETLADTFPTYNAQYYFQLLMQHARKRDGRCKINLWNAFINDQRDKV